MINNFLWSCEQPVWPNALQEAVGHSRLKMRCFLLGSVETPLEWCRQFS